MRSTSAILAGTALCAALARSSFAAQSTPPPGGANERAGYTGPVSAVLFNGKLRLRNMKVARKTEDGERYLVFSSVLANGTSEDRVTYLEAHLADADGVTIDQSPGDPVEGPCTLAPGAACRQSFRFKLQPDDFHPVKILLEEEGNGPQPVFRVTLGNL